MPVKPGKVSSKPSTVTEWKQSPHYFPAETDDELFEHLMLAINIAGMNWLMVFNKRANFEKAFKNFNVAKVAKFGDADLERLLADTGIIRNEKKILAAVENAKAIQTLQKSHGSFRKWLEENRDLHYDDWCKLMKKTFVFAGPGVTHMFLLGTGLIDEFEIQGAEC
jgi:DNA-3-methyladenine glycosylase I